MLQRTSAQPLYAQAKSVLLDRLDREVYKVNEKIPSESDLCLEFGISRMTLRSVLSDLVKDGRLYRIQGKGTFVSEPKIVADSTSYIGMREQLEAQGYNVSTTVLKVEKILPPRSVMRVMDLAEDEKVYHIQRVRSVKGTPLSIHNSYIPVSLCPNFQKNDFCNEQLCSILSSDYGLQRDSVVETLESASATASEAEVLGIEKGYPLLRLCDSISDKNGTVFEYSIVAFRGDKIQLRLKYDV